MAELAPCGIPAKSRAPVQSCVHQASRFIPGGPWLSRFMCVVLTS